MEFQEVQITLLWHNRARNKHIMKLRQNEWDFSRNTLLLVTGHRVWCALWPNADLLYVGNKCASFESLLPVHWAERVQIWRWSSRSGFSESTNNKHAGSNKVFSPDRLLCSHLLCNIPDIKMSLNQWRTGGGWCERAQCRWGWVSH